MKSPTALDSANLLQKAQQEKNRADFLNDSCKKYLLAYEKSKREVDRLTIENERLKSRIAEVREISLAKEANYEMISSLGALDQEFFQSTIEKLRQENHVLKEENRLLKEISDFNLQENKKQLFSVIKDRQEQVILQNAQLLFQNEALRSDLAKSSIKYDELYEKHNELLNRQLDQAKLLVRKDEEIKFWKCSITELICGEMLKSYREEAEIKLLLDSPLDPADKFIRIKDRLSRLLHKKFADSIGELSIIPNTSKLEDDY
jgi:hypothetical protein